MKLIGTLIINEKDLVAAILRTLSYFFGEIQINFQTLYHGIMSLECTQPMNTSWHSFFFHHMYRDTWFRRCCVPVCNLLSISAQPDPQEAVCTPQVSPLRGRAACHHPVSVRVHNCHPWRLGLWHVAVPTSRIALTGASSWKLFFSLLIPDLP